MFEEDFLVDVWVEWLRKIFKISPYGSVCGALWIRLDRGSKIQSFWHCLVEVTYMSGSVVVLDGERGSCVWIGWTDEGGGCIFGGNSFGVEGKGLYVFNKEKMYSIECEVLE